MIEGFDKEIDAILRKARDGESVILNNSHLDADEITAFAENALPEKSKPLYTKHLADCDRCRRILSNIILLNAEAEEVPVFVAAKEIKTIPVLPWYRKLFAFPNLAYSLGALVLVFGGLIGFIALQSRNEMSLSQVSKDKPFETKSAPVSNVANNTVATSNTATATNTTTANTILNSNSASVSSANVPSNTLNAPSNSTTAANSSIPPKPSILSKEQKQDAPIVAADESVTQPQATPNTENENADAAVTARSLPKNPTKRIEEKDDGKTLKNEAQKDTQKPNSTSAMGATSGETVNIKGKTFNRRNNIWIDSEYRGQATTNITRGTEDYKKLDSDLRQTVERLGGTVVIVWKTKAYKIQ